MESTMKKNEKKEKKPVMGFEGGFTYWGMKIFDIVMLSLLWLLCSLPVITMGASFSALYYAVKKSVKDDNGYASEEFWRSFKQNLKPGIILWVIVLAVGFILLLNMGILNALTEGNVGLFFIIFYGACFAFLVGMASYMFPALSRFDMNAGWILKTSMYMTVRYFPTTIVLLFILVMAYLIVFKMPLFIVFVPGVVTFLFTEFMENVLAKHSPEE